MKEAHIEKEIDRDRIIDDLKEMISIPSVVGDEYKLATFLGKRLEEMGIEPRYQPVEDKRRNVYGLYRFAKDGPLVTLNGHMDTVPICDGWETDPFEPIQKDGKLYGLGSCDMKAGLATLLEALRVLVKSGIELNGTIAFSGVVDEEAYSKGAKKLLSTKLSHSNAIIIGEPHFGTKESSVPIGITGKILYEVVAKGKSAHGFHPEKGINAVEDMARLLSSLSNLPKRVHPQFGKGNICILKVEGGYKEYAVVVPDRCRAIINRLIVPGEDIQSALEDMENLIKDLSLRTDFKVTSKSPSYDPFTLPENEPIFKAFKDSYRIIKRVEPAFGYHRSIMDANVFVNRAGIPTLVFGPGGGGIHGPNEYTEVSTLTSSTKIYVRTIVNYLSHLTDEN